MKDNYMNTEMFFPDEEETIAQIQAKRKARKSGQKKHLALTFLLLILLGFVSFLLSMENSLFQRTATMKYGWNLVLVNRDYQVPTDYVGELVTLRNGQQVDSRIYPDLQEMFDQMRMEGVYPIVASGYRTEKRQRQLLDQEIREQEDGGRSWLSARREALKWVSIPGTSEHQLGIAVDINQEGSKSTAKQVYGWLAENAHRYGFICRYPEDKQAITGIENEPWHYRYVGRDAAAEIYEKGICLEEYLEELQGR